MGQSPSATIFFGYAFNEPSTMPGTPEFGYEDENDPRHGWEPCQHYFHKVLKKTVEEIEEMGWEESRDLWAAIPIEFEWWGYMDDSCYMIHPTGVFVTNSWDAPLKLDTDMFKNNDAQVAWIEPLKKFIKDMDIDVKGEEPAWHLVVSYG
jgi:hypothetical protein